MAGRRTRVVCMTVLALGCLSVFGALLGEESPQVTPTFTEFDVPGAGASTGLGTEPLNVNSGGVIAGVYSDSAEVFHGFLRAADGTITTFDVPGAGAGALKVR